MDSWALSVSTEDLLAVAEHAAAVDHPFDRIEAVIELASRGVYKDNETALNVIREINHPFDRIEAVLVLASRGAYKDNETALNIIREIIAEAS